MPHDYQIHFNSSRCFFDLVACSLQLLCAILLQSFEVADGGLDITEQVNTACIAMQINCFAIRT